MLRGFSGHSRFDIQQAAQHVIGGFDDADISLESIARVDLLNQITQDILAIGRIAGRAGSGFIKALRGGYNPGCGCADRGHIHTMRAKT